MLSSLICSADGAGVGDGESGGGVGCWVFEAEQGSQVQSLFFYRKNFYLQKKKLSIYNYVQYLQPVILKYMSLD